jgi:hypothetical protein
VFDELIPFAKVIYPAYDWAYRDQFPKYPSRRLCPVGVQFSQPANLCYRWLACAVERFANPWNSTLKNPIIIGNKADPATPILGASLVAGWLDGSAPLVEQGGFSRTSFAQDSTRTPISSRTSSSMVFTPRATILSVLSILVVPNFFLPKVSRLRTSGARFRETITPVPRVPSRSSTASRLKRIFSLRLSPWVYITHLSHLLLLHWEARPRVQADLYQRSP